MGTPTVHKVQGSMLKITVSSTLTELPGVDNVELDLGENGIIEASDISSDYKGAIASGLRDTGSISADLIRDPLNAVHQALQAAYNTAAAIPCSFTVGATGLILTLSVIIKKLPMSGKKGDGFMGKLEGVLASKVNWNSAAP